MKYQNPQNKCLEYLSKIVLAVFTVMTLSCDLNICTINLKFAICGFLKKLFS